MMSLKHETHSSIDLYWHRQKNQPPKYSRESSTVPWSSCCSRLVDRLPAARYCWGSSREDNDAYMGGNPDQNSLTWGLLVPQWNWEEVCPQGEFRKYQNQPLCSKCHAERHQTWVQGGQWKRDCWSPSNNQTALDTNDRKLRNSFILRLTLLFFIPEEKTKNPK